MQIAELVKRKKQRVTVRVPAKLRDELGDEVTGIVMGLVWQNSVTLVKVKVRRN